MATAWYAEKVKAVARYDIPAPLAREIGRFLVTWAHFEHYTQAIIWNTLGLGVEEGRIAVREPRVTDRLAMIEDLGSFQSLEMDYVLLRDIRKRADPLAGKRHLLAHTIWTKLDNGWCPLDTRGSWQPRPEEIENYPSGSKLIQPESLPVTSEEIREWTMETVQLIEDLKRIGDQNRPLPASPQKSRKRRPRKDRA